MVFRALMGGSGSGRDDVSSRGTVRRKSSTTNGESSRRTSRISSSASSVSSSRRPTRGDDRDRGLGDISASRSVTGDSTTTYVTAEPKAYVEEEPLIIERIPRSDRADDRQRSGRDNDRDARRKSEKNSTETRSSRDDATSRDRTQPRARSSGDGVAHFAAEIADPAFTQFPMQYDSSNIPGTTAPYHPPLDVHIAQQFPGQLPETTAQPYMPPNPAGLAADYYGDQGQSVAHQPGVRPQAPDIIIGAQPHLQAASPIANPPPEPSSLGQVGAAAEYYAGGDTVPVSSAPATSKPPRPGKPSRPSAKPSRPTSGSSFSADSASFGIGSELLNQASSHYPQTSATQSRPPLQATAGTSSSHNGMGLALGGAAAGAAAAYMLNHHNDQSGSNSQYGNRPDHNSNSYGLGIGPSGNGHSSSSFQGNTNPSGPPGYSSRPSLGPSYSSSGMQPGSLAYHQKHHGPLSAFVNFWRDPEGVGKFEEYTEAIGVCKYCFEPGTTSRDAPRKHHYNRRRRSPVVDRYGSSSRVDKLTRYNSSEDESRRNKSKVTSWFAGGLTGGLAGYVAKSLFDNRNFEDSYSVRTGSRAESSRRRTYDQESLVSSSKASSTSCGVVSRKSSGHDKSSAYKDTKSYRYSRRSSRSRSRSTSRDRRSSSGLKEAAIGAAVGTALTAASMRSSQRNRSRERSTQHRTRRHSDSSGSENFERSRRRGRSSPQGFRSFFTAPSANRLKKSTKKERGFFSFGNSSSSSDDYDLAFGGHEKLGSTFSGRFSRSSKSVKSSRNSKVDAEILGLGLMARQLAHSSSRKELSPRALVRPPNYGQASTVEDDEWEDAESSDSTVSANLAYGGSAVFGSQESVSSGPSFWPWSKSSRKKKKKKKEEEEAQRQYSEAPPMNDYSSQPAEYVSNDGSSGRGSLQRVYPVPTSDPSRFDYVRMSTTSSPNGEPQLIRPGPIPLQQPQPQPVVSQSVYYPTVAAAVDPLIQRDGLESQVLTRSTQRPRRSNSSPVYPQMPLESEPSPGILKRRSTAKDPANVSIYLTEEQKERQKEVDRLDWERQRRRKEEEFALLRREADELAETECRRQAKEKRRAERRRLEEEEIAAQAARDARREQRRRETDVGEQSVVVSKVEATDVPRKSKRKDEGSKETASSSSWVTPALVGAGAVAVAGVLAEKALEDDEHVTSRDRFDKRREERRSQRRRAAETQSEITEFSQQEPIREAVEVDDDQATRQQRIVKNAASRIAQSPSTVHESYQDFFMPEDLRHDTDDNHDSSPNIIEIVPRSERPVQAYLGSDIDKPDPSWPPLVINIIKPTPPGSHEGSVRDSHSPAPTTDSSTQEVQVEEAEEPAPSRPSTGSRVSWGEHQFHEYDIETPLSEREESVDERDHEERPVSPEYRDHENHYETSADEKSVSRQMDTESYQPDSKHSMPGSFDDDVEFAATLAAGAEIAGFDPSVVTDDATYYTKDKSPVAELKENYRSPAVESVTDLGETISTKPSVEKKVSRGPEISFDDEVYNNNEEASSKELSKVNEGNDFERRSVVAVAEAEYYDAPAAFEREEDKVARVETLPDEPTTASRDRSKKSKKSKRWSKTLLDDLVDTESEKNSRAIASSDIQSSKSQPSTTPASDDAEPEYTLKRIQSAPVTDDLIREEQKRHRRRSKHSSLDRSDSVDDGTRSVAAALAPGVDELEEYRSRRSSRRFKHDDEVDLDDDNDDETRSLHDVDEEDGERRRRRKHKRHSGNFDDVASVFSSPAKIDETLREKHRSRDSSVASKELSRDREKKSGGLFSSIFGGSKTNLDRSQSTSSKRETQSEVATAAAATDDSTSERRRKKKSSSSSRRSVSGDDVVVDDWDVSNRAAEESPLDLSQLSKAFDNNENGDNDSQSSRRKRREQRRRDKYEEIIDSAREASEKDQSSTTDVYDNDDKKSFLGTRPEMPPVDDDSHEEHSITEENMGGASGLGILPTALQSTSTPSQPSNLDDPLLHDVRQQQQQQQQQRLRSRSVSPSMAEKTFELTPRSQSRPSSPGGRAPSSSSEEGQNDLRARRLSVLRNSDSPTAVPLHFRKPPTSPNSSHRRVSMTSLAQSQSPVSPRPGGGHRRPNSVEFKNAREIRPLWLVERHSSSKLDTEPEGPLPSLPSSKTSSRSPSVENLREGWPEEEDAVTGFFMGGGGGHGGGGESAYSWGRKPIDLRISTDHLPAEEDDFLNSQQATPTAETYISSSSSKQVVGPPPIKKEKPKYEFHSPSELLQDPTVYQSIVPEMPESIDRLPSVAGSDLSVKENEAAIQDPTNAEELDIARETEKDSVSHQAKEKAPDKAQKGSSNISFLAGAGFGAIVDAAVSAAVRDHETNTRNVEQSEGVAKVSHHEEARQEISADDLTRDHHHPASVSSTLKDHGGNFGDVVDAAVAAAVAGTSRGNTAQEHTTAVDEAVGQSRYSELTAEPVDAGIPAAAAALVDAQPDIDGTADAGSNSKKQKRKDKKKKKKGKDTGTPAEEVVEVDLKSLPDAEIGSSSVQPEPEVVETARAEPSTEPVNASSSPTTTAQQEEAEEDESLRTQNESPQITNVSASLESVQDDTRDIQPVDPDPDPLAAVEPSLETGTTASTGNDAIAEVNDQEDAVVKDANEEDSGPTTASASKSSKKKKKNKRKSSIQSDPVSVGEGAENASAAIEEPQPIIDKKIEPQVSLQETSPPLSSPTQIPTEPEVRTEEMQLGTSDQGDNNKVQESVEDSQSNERGADTAKEVDAPAANENAESATSPQSPVDEWFDSTETAEEQSAEALDDAEAFATSSKTNVTEELQEATAIAAAPIVAEDVVEEAPATPSSSGQKKKKNKKKKGRSSSVDEAVTQDSTPELAESVQLTLDGPGSSSLQDDQPQTQEISQNLSFESEPLSAETETKTVEDHGNEGERLPETHPQTRDVSEMQPDLPTESAPVETPEPKANDNIPESSNEVPTTDSVSRTEEDLTSPGQQLPEETASTPSKKKKGKKPKRVSWAEPTEFKFESEPTTPVDPESPAPEINASSEENAVKLQSQEEQMTSATAVDTVSSTNPDLEPGLEKEVGETSPALTHQDQSVNEPENVSVPEPLPSAESTSDTQPESNADSQDVLSLPSGVDSSSHDSQQAVKDIDEESQPAESKKKSKKEKRKDKNKRKSIDSLPAADDKPSSPTTAISTDEGAGPVDEDAIPETKELEQPKTSEETPLPAITPEVESENSEGLESTQAAAVERQAPEGTAVEAMQNPENEEISHTPLVESSAAGLESTTSEAVETLESQASSHEVSDTGDTKSLVEPHMEKQDGEAVTAEPQTVAAVESSTPPPALISSDEVKSDAINSPSTEQLASEGNQKEITVIDEPALPETPTEEAKPADPTQDDEPNFQSSKAKKKKDKKKKKSEAAAVAAIASLTKEDPADPVAPIEVEENTGLAVSDDSKKIEDPSEESTKFDEIPSVVTLCETEHSKDSIEYPVNEAGDLSEALANQEKSPESVQKTETDATTEESSPQKDEQSLKEVATESILSTPLEQQTGKVSTVEEAPPADAKESQSSETPSSQEAENIDAADNDGKLSKNSKSKKKKDKKKQKSRLSLTSDEVSTPPAPEMVPEETEAKPVEVEESTPSEPDLLTLDKTTAMDSQNESSSLVIQEAENPVQEEQISEDRPDDNAFQETSTSKKKKGKKAKKAEKTAEARLLNENAATESDALRESGQNTRVLTEAEADAAKEPEVIAPNDEKIEGSDNRLEESRVGEILAEGEKTTETVQELSSELPRSGEEEQCITPSERILAVDVEPQTPINDISTEPTATETSQAPVLPSEAEHNLNDTSKEQVADNTIVENSPEDTEIAIAPSEDAIIESNALQSGENIDQDIKKFPESVPSLSQVDETPNPDEESSEFQTPIESFDNAETNNVEQVQEAETIDKDAPAAEAEQIENPDDEKSSLSSSKSKKKKDKKKNRKSLQSIADDAESTPSATADGMSDAVLGQTGEAVAPLSQAVLMSEEMAKSSDTANEVQATDPTPQEIIQDESVPEQSINIEDIDSTPKSGKSKKKNGKKNKSRDETISRDEELPVSATEKPEEGLSAQDPVTEDLPSQEPILDVKETDDKEPLSQQILETNQAKTQYIGDNERGAEQTETVFNEVEIPRDIELTQEETMHAQELASTPAKTDEDANIDSLDATEEIKQQPDVNISSLSAFDQIQDEHPVVILAKETASDDAGFVPATLGRKASKKKKREKVLADSSDQQALFTPSPTTEQEPDLPSYDSSRQEEQVTKETAVEESLHQDENKPPIENAKSSDSSGADIGPVNEESETKPAEPTRRLSAKEKRKEKKKRRTLEIGGGIDVSNEGEEIPSEPTLVESPAPETNQLEEHDRFSSEAGEKRKENETFPTGGEEQVKESFAEHGTKLDGGRNPEDLADYVEQQIDSGSKSNSDEQTDVSSWPGTTENEPQETPVEVEGKETFESSEETHIDQKEKDLDLTDNMVSPQVQSPFPVRSPTFDSHQDIDQSRPHAAVDDLRSSNAVVSDSLVQPEAIVQELAVDEEQEPKETPTGETALVDPEDQGLDWSTSKKSKKDKKKKKQKSIVATPTENFIENENTTEPSTEEKDKLQNMDLSSVEVSQSKDTQEGFAAEEPSSIPEPSLQTDEITKDGFEPVAAESENFRSPYKESDNDGMLPESNEAPIIAKVENVELEPLASEEIQEADTEELKTSVAPITSADTSADKSASDEVIPEILGEDDSAPVAKPLGRKLSKKEKRKLNKEKKAPSDYEEPLAEDSEKQETARDAPEDADAAAIDNLMSAEIQEAKPATEAIATTKDSSDLNDADDSVPAAQDPIPRKLSKKEKRKNKKLMTSDLAEDDSADVDRTNISNEANLQSNSVDELQKDLKEDEILAVSSEQPAEYPRVSLDPFDVPEDGPSDAIGEELNMPDTVKRQSDSEIDFEAVLQARQLEKEGDLAAAGALFEKPALPKSKEIVSRQSSKKQKGKKNKKDKTSPALKEDNLDTVGIATAQTEVIPQGDTTQKETDDMVFSESNIQLSRTATEPGLEYTGERSAKEEEPGMDASGSKIDLQANTTDQDRAFVADDSTTANTRRPLAVATSDIHEDGTRNAGQRQGSRTHSPNSQKEDVDMIISATMGAAGFSPSIITGSTEAIKSTNIQSQDKPSRFLNEVLDGREVLGVQKGNFKPSLATTKTTEEKSPSKKINDIFPGLERVKYRKPSPKSQEKQIDSARSMEEPSLPIVPTPVKTPQVVKTLPSNSNREFAPTEVESTSKDRSSSLLFDSSPSIRLEPTPDTSSLRAASSPIRLQRSSGSLHRTQSIHGHHSGPHHNWQLEDELTPTKRASNQLPQPSINADKFERSPPRTPLDPIKEYDGHKLGTGENPYKLERPDSRNSRPLRKVNRSISGDLRAIAAASTASLSNEAEGGREREREERGRGDRAIHEANRDGTSAATQSDLHQKGKVARQGKRGLSQPLAAPQTRREAAEEDEDNHDDDDDDHDRQLLEQIPSSSTYDPVTDKGKRPVRGMSDVYEGWGETPNSPRSPTRPPSIRRRQSMQHLQELETRLDQLISENRLLVAAKEEAEQKLSRVGVARRKSDQALNTSNADLRDKEAEIARLTSSLEWMQSEVQRLTDENEAAHAKHAELTASHAREVDGLRTRQLELASGMEGIVKEQISAALAEKDAELRRLRDELAAARQAVQELQQQIVAATAADVLSIHDEDYFDNACQRLCQHVQQWVLRFSKNSDLRRCRLLSEVRNTTVTDRFDNAILDGTDVDSILADRVRRRDVFVAVVMAMIWEYVFTRYLFGMDRDQRQKLKALEKQLSEVGPQRAVAHWRALTLTLLAKRPSFADQRVKDTEAVALEIMETLSQLLPPPQSAQSQLLESLRGVLRRAANLSIEMRTQRAEYVMLPPLQPEYDSQGDLARQVSFNAALMNERSGIYNSNEALEAQGTAVRLVLFPLVVKKGDDLGGGDEEIVVCPAQVLVAWPDNEKPRERDRMSTFGNRSVSSVVPSVDMGNMI